MAYTIELSRALLLDLMMHSSVWHRWATVLNVPLTVRITFVSEEADVLRGMVESFAKPDCHMRSHEARLTFLAKVLSHAPCSTWRRPRRQCRHLMPEKDCSCLGTDLGFDAAPTTSQIT